MRWEIDRSETGWELWFAWFPVKLSEPNTYDPIDRWVWWEWVQRQTLWVQGYKFHHYRDGDAV